MHIMPPCDHAHPVFLLMTSLCYAACDHAHLVLSNSSTYSVSVLFEDFDFAVQAQNARPLMDQVLAKENPLFAFAKCS